ncbi:MAG: hypothetical protein R3A50_04135 [Saprospiraceae bacterium]
MNQSQLVELIRVLTSEEKEQILKISSITLFSGSKMRFHIAPLLEYCFAQNWDDPDFNLTKDDVYTKSFPNQVNVAGKLEKTMVEAQKLIQKFLITQQYLNSDNEFRQIYDFGQIVRQRGLDSRYKQSLNRLDKIQNESLCKNAPYYNHQFDLELAKHDEASVRNQVKGDLNIPNTLLALEIYSHIHRLALLNVYLLQQKAANIRYCIEMYADEL